MSGPLTEGSVLVTSDIFPYIYDELLTQLVYSKLDEINQRTGVRIRTLPGAVSFKIDISDQKLPVTGSRKLYPHVAATEVAWFAVGDRTASWMTSRGVSIWDKFVEKANDGTPLDVIKAAYGYRWRHQFGRDQLWLAIEALKKNETDRRIWVQAWDPAEDGLGAEGQRNVPCPIGFTFSIVDGMLHSSLFIRSSDVFVGLPYDVMGHAMLMAVVAASIPCAGLGTMHVTLAHPHLYENHFGMAEECVKGLHNPVGPDLLAWPLKQVRSDPDGFIWAYRKAAQGVAWPTYSPKPELIV